MYRLFAVLLTAFACGVPLILAQESPKQNAQVVTVFQVAGFNVQSTFALRVPKQYHWRWASNDGSYVFFGQWGRDSQTTSGWSYSGHTYSLLTPGVMYELGLSGWYDYGEVKVIPPPGYRVMINDRPTSTLRSPGNAGGGYSLHVATMCIVPENDSSRLPAGMALPPRVGDLLWSISAGFYANGMSAGAIQWRTNTLSQALLDPASLDYAAPLASEIEVTRHSVDGALVEVKTSQMVLQVRRNSTPGTGYDIEIYSPLALPTSGSGDGPFEYTEAPYRVYRISNPEGATWAGKVKIEKREPNALGHMDTTESWTIGQTATQWTLTETNGLRVTTRQSSTTSPRVETIEVKDHAGTVSTRLQRTYANKPWNQEELVQEIANPTNENGTAIRTDYEYHEVGGLGSFGRLKSVYSPDSGFWERYEYDSSPTGFGNLSAILRPWQDGAGATVSTATVGNCQATILSYASELGHFLTLPAGAETRIGGVTVAMTEVSYAFPGVAQNGQPVVTQTVQNFTRTDVALTSVRQLYNPRTADAEYVGRTVWERAPDGTKVVYLRYKGQQQDFGDNGVWVKKPIAENNAVWGEYRFYGFSAPVENGVAVTSFDGELMDSFYMVPNRSMVEIQAYDKHGQVRHVTKAIFTGASGGVPSFECIDRDTRGYYQGILSNYSSINGHQEILWLENTGRISGYTGNDGVYRQLGYDALSRPVLTSVGDVGSWSEYPGHPSYYVHRSFDTSDRVVGETITPSLSNSTTPEAVSTTRTYNTAGQLTSETTAGLTTNYSYPFGGRIVEAKLPGPQSGPQLRNTITERYLDGSVKSTTGSAVVPTYTKTELSTASGETGYLQTTTYTAVNNGSRWVRVTRDWAGRVVREERPALNGTAATTFTKTNFYDDAVADGAKTKGKLIRTEEDGLAPTLYEYNDWRSLYRTGLKLSAGTSLGTTTDDRITETDSVFEKDTSATWWLKTTTKVYKNSSGGTATVSVEKTQLSKFTNGIQARSVSSDIFENVSTRTVTIDRANQLVTETIDHPDSTTDEITVYRRGLLQKRQTKDGLVFWTYYDARGRPIKTTDPRVDQLSPAQSGFAPRIGYVSNTDRIAWRQDTAGKQTDYAYDPITGRLSTLTAPEPAVGVGRPITRYEYDTLNRVVRTWGSGVYPTQYAYGTYGERVSLTTYQAGDVQAIWNQSTWPASAPTGQATLWNYDGATGLLLNKTDASGELVSYAYTRRGQISGRTWARNIKTLYTYDQGTGELTHIRYRLADETTPEGTPDLTYTYNRLGHLVSAVQSNGFTTTYDLCDCGKPLAEILDSTYYGNRRIDYHLHPTADGTKGRTMGYTLSLGSTAEQTIGYAYQASGRFGGLTVDGQQFTYGYTPLSPLVASLTHAGSNWSQTRIYEENRNLLDVIETKWATLAQGRFDYTSDALGRRTSVAKSGELFARYGTNGLDTAWGYNDRSEVISEITRLGGTSTVLAGRNDAYSYDNIGNRSSTAGTTHNGTTASYTVNALNQYSQREVEASSDVTGLAPASSTVKIDGDATGITRQGDWYYKAQAYTGARPGKQALAITNWFGSAQNGPVMNRDAYLPVTPEPFAYDKDGNLIRDGRWVYQYDAENRLIAQFTRGAPADDPQANQPANTAVWNSGVARQKLQFTYDHLGRRIGKLVSDWNATGSAWVPTTHRKFIYEGWNLIAELNAAAGNALLRTYAWGLDLSGSKQGAGGVGGLVAIREGGNTFLPVFDGNGNVMGMTTATAVTFTINGNSVSYAAGSLVAAYEYDAFGQTLRENGPYSASNPIRFSTKYTDSETGQVYYGYRFYSPTLGRFINRDPISESGGLNLYAFVGNNGVGRTDYLGMIWVRRPTWCQYSYVERADGTRYNYTVQCEYTDVYIPDGMDELGGPARRPRGGGGPSESGGAGQSGGESPEDILVLPPVVVTPGPLPPNVNTNPQPSGGTGDLTDSRVSATALNNKLSQKDCDTLASKIANAKQTLGGMVDKVSDESLAAKIASTVWDYAGDASAYSGLFTDFAEGGYRLAKTGLDMAGERGYRKALTSVYKSASPYMNKIGVVSNVIDAGQIGVDIYSRDGLGLIQHVAEIGSSALKVNPAISMALSAFRFTWNNQAGKANTDIAAMDATSAAAYRQEQSRNAVIGLNNVKQWQKEFTDGGCK